MKQKVLFAVLLCQHALVGLPSIYSASRTYPIAFQCYNRETEKYDKYDQKKKSYQVEIPFNATVSVVKSKIAKRLNVQVDGLVIYLVPPLYAAREPKPVKYEDDDEEFYLSKSDGLLVFCQKHRGEEIPYTQPPNEVTVHVIIGEENKKISMTLKETVTIKELREKLKGEIQKDKGVFSIQKNLLTDTDSFSHLYSTYCAFEDKKLKLNKYGLLPYLESGFDNTRFYELDLFYHSDDKVTITNGKVLQDKDAEIVTLKQRAVDLNKQINTLEGKQEKFEISLGFNILLATALSIVTFFLMCDKKRSEVS